MGRAHEHDATAAHRATDRRSQIPKERLGLVQTLLRLLPKVRARGWFVKPASPNNEVLWC
eukprot:4774959-Prymnesium_polylepis.1